MKKRMGILGVLIAVLALGIGYAAITAVTLTLNGTGTITPDQTNFKVHYTGTPSAGNKTPSTLTTTQTITSDDTVGEFSVTGMTKKDDTVTFTYTIINESEGELGATLGTPTITYNDATSSEYFTVTSSTASSTLAAGGATTTQTVVVTAKKTPIGSSDITGSFKIELSATPTNS